MNFGGPVWHASAAWHPRFAHGIAPLWAAPVAKLWAAAEAALAGVGDAALGAWRHTEPRSVHVRHRVTAAEWGDRPWGMDYRKTVEGRARLEEVVRRLPERLRDEVMAEVM